MVATHAVLLEEGSMNHAYGSMIARGTMFVLLLLAVTGSVFAQPLSGTYTIGGASPSYASFGAAVSDLISRGVSGAVTFNVRAGTYTEHIDLLPISGSSG